MPVRSADRAAVAGRADGDDGPVGCDAPAELVTASGVLGLLVIVLGLFLGAVTLLGWGFGQIDDARGRGGPRKTPRAP